MYLLFRYECLWHHGDTTWDMTSNYTSSLVLVILLIESILYIELQSAYPPDPTYRVMTPYLKKWSINCVFANLLIILFH